MARIAAAEPDALVVCAYGVLIKEPLLGAYEIFNVHPSLLPRWRGAAPIERAIMAGDAETGVSIMRLTAGLDSGPVCLRGGEPIGPDDDYGTLSARLQERSGALLVQRARRAPALGRAGTGRHHLRAQDRGRRPRAGRDPHAGGARAPGARAAPAHRGAAAAPGRQLPRRARGPARTGPTLAPAGGHLRADGDRLVLDCRGGALELTEIQPPGGRPMPAEAWLRGRPDPALTDFWLDPRLPERPLEELIPLAVGEWDSPEEWAPYLSALGWRGTPEVLAALAPLAGEADPRARSVAAYVAGQLGAPVRTMPEESAALLEAMGEREGHAGVLAVIAEAFGHLGEPWGLSWLLRLRRHPTRACATASSPRWPAAPTRSRPTP